MKKFSKLIRWILPEWILAYAKRFKNKKISNFYGTDFKKRVLISYIVSPFKSASIAHTNNFEAQVSAEIFNEFDYQVDITHYENLENTDLNNYDVLYGFGETLEYFFKTTNNRNSKVILYSTGMSMWVQNANTLNRVRDFYGKKKVWLINSSRLTDKKWFRQILLSDSIISLGNNHAMASFQPFYKGALYKLNAPFFKTRDYLNSIQFKANNASKNFVWFGSSGLLHKGLDLCLDYFSSRPDLTLHLCGFTREGELDFLRAYQKEIFETPNIVYHGFIDIKSEKFEKLLKSAYFTIFPSCSEGGSPAVLTLIGNGGFIPLITRECSVTIPNGICIEALDMSSIECAIIQALEIKDNELLRMATENAAYVNKHNSLEQYKSDLKAILQKVLFE